MSAKGSYYNYRNAKAYSRTPTNGRAIKTRRFFKKSGHRHDRRAVVEMLREEIENLSSEQLLWWDMAGYEYDPQSEWNIGIDFSDGSDESAFFHYNNLGAGDLDDGF